MSNGRHRQVPTVRERVAGTSGWRSGLVVAEDRAQALGLGEPATVLTGRRVGRAGALESLQLLAEVGLQARAVLALEGPQVVDLVGERVALALEVAEQLGAALGGLGGGGRGAPGGVRLELVGVGLGLALEPLGLGARLADDLVGLALGVLDQLVGVAAGQLEQAGRRGGGGAG